MDNWRERFENRFLNKETKEWRGRPKRIPTPNDIIKFIEQALYRERKRDKIEGILDFIKESKTKTAILVNYVDIELNKNCCSSRQPSEELLLQLGIHPGDREALILFILECFFSLPKELYTKKN